MKAKFRKMVVALKRSHDYLLSEHPSEQVQLQKIHQVLREQTAEIARLSDALEREQGVREDAQRQLKQASEQAK